MINLLSPTAKKEVHGARLNVILLRYCIILLVTTLFLTATFGAGFYLTHRDKVSAEEQKQLNQLQIDKFQAVKTETQEFTANLKSAKAILGDEIVFSQLIADIAGVLPPGVVLNSLNLTSKSFGAPLTLSARTTDYPTAVTLKNTLEASPVFEKVNIQSIAQVEPANDSSVNDKYLITVTIDTILSKKPVTPLGTGN